MRKQEGGTRTEPEVVCCPASRWIYQLDEFWNFQIRHSRRFGLFRYHQRITSVSRGISRGSKDPFTKRLNRRLKGIVHLNLIFQPILIEALVTNPHNHLDFYGGNQFHPLEVYCGRELQCKKTNQTTPRPQNNRQRNMSPYCSCGVQECARPSILVCPVNTMLSAKQSCESHVNGRFWQHVD